MNRKREISKSWSLAEWEAYPCSGFNVSILQALDGGRLVFLLIEAVRGKALPQEKESMVHFLGFVLLMGLMVVVLLNDLRQIFL